MLTLLRGSGAKLDPAARQFLAQIRSDAQNTITVRAVGAALPTRPRVPLTAVAGAAPEHIPLLRSSRGPDLEHARRAIYVAALRAAGAA